LTAVIRLARTLLSLQQDSGRQLCRLRLEDRNMKVTRIVLIALASLTAGVLAQAQTYGQYPPQQPPPGYPGTQQPYPDQRNSNQQYPDPRYGDPNYDDYDNYVGDDGYGNDSGYQYSPVYDTRAANGDLGIFYRELAPYGQWLRHPYYGWVWFPSAVGYDWRPYTVGRWVNTNYGWTWVSYEPFGWATYHYGRWAFDRQIGWIWIPGTVWGPAWVAWQQGSGYVGWAPLPPQVGFQVGVGIRLGGVNLSLSLAPTTYSFVDERQFLESRIDRYIQPSARNVTIIQRTRNITDYGYENNRVINRGVPVERIEQITRRPVRRLEVTESQSRESQVGSDQVRIYRPAPEVLRSAPIAERNNEGIQRQPRQYPRGQVNPSTDQGRGRPNVAPMPAPVQVVPSPRPSGRTDFDRVQEQQRRELERAAQEERKKLEQAQQQEARQPRQNSAQLQQQHQAELKAQQEMQQRQEQQMKNRLQIERQAQGAPPASQKDKENEARNKRNNKNKDKHNQDQGEASPPPRR
jgi:hypothetical protein